MSEIKINIKNLPFCCYNLLRKFAKLFNVRLLVIMKLNEKLYCIPLVLLNGITITQGKNALCKNNNAHIVYSNFRMYFFLYLNSPARNVIMDIYSGTIGVLLFNQFYLKLYRERSVANFVFRSKQRCILFEILFSR